MVTGVNRSRVTASLCVSRGAYTVSYIKQNKGRSPMTKDERQRIMTVLSHLDSAFDPDALEYRFANVCAAHRILRKLDLTPPTPRKVKA